MRKEEIKKVAEFYTSNSDGIGEQLNKPQPQSKSKSQSQSQHGAKKDKLYKEQKGKKWYKRGGCIYVENSYDLYRETTGYLTKQIIQQYWDWCVSTIISDKPKPNLYYINDSRSINSFNPFSSGKKI